MPTIGKWDMEWVVSFQNDNKENIATWGGGCFNKVVKAEVRLL